MPTVSPPQPSYLVLPYFSNQEGVVSACIYIYQIFLLFYFSSFATCIQASPLLYSSLIKTTYPSMHKIVGKLLCAF